MSPRTAVVLACSESRETCYLAVTDRWSYRRRRALATTLAWVARVASSLTLLFPSEFAEKPPPSPLSTPSPSHHHPIICCDNDEFTMLIHRTP